MLKFIGTGSAFHRSLGCNSAFVRIESAILFFDFGGDVFSRVLEEELLTGVSDVHIMITHLHPDHVGSLGDMIFYNYYILQRKVTVLFSDPSMINFLALQGVSIDFYTAVYLQPGQSNTHGLGNDLLEITPIRTVHFPGLLSFGYLVKKADDNDMNLYYSGDSQEIPAQVLSSFFKKEVHWLYQDTCGLDYENNPHLSISKLLQVIPTTDRDRVVCMHLDSHIDVRELHNAGFHVAARI